MVLEQKDLPKLNLLTCSYDSVQNGETLHAAVLDFSKAFDKVPHQRLLKKLNYYGIAGNFPLWFESFLVGRYQSVVCEGKISPSRTVNSGSGDEEIVYMDIC
ncbi:Hypothetical predicted protein [Paramuricea clavata]|uniref:Reverse transcriptase domain-containing protein n=1 Tax=Paramuricea clavata TaxID=317549 RepID=A0A7D9HMX2_PARCT|nr:Hypothetical predicted protein [Paramuricea clavata]